MFRRVPALSGARLDSVFIELAIGNRRISQLDDFICQEFVRERWKATNGTSLGGMVDFVIVLAEISAKCPISMVVSRN